MEAMKIGVVALAVIGLCVSPVSGQTPRPFPLPETPRAQAPQEPATQAPTAPSPAPLAPLPTVPIDPSAPSDASLGMPIYPAAQFIASYDAGRGQRYHVFGTSAPFDSIVAYYRSQLDERGDRVFDEPPTHVFEFGRYDDDTMAFPPGVTVKDWTWGGSLGYPNPAPRPEFGLPERFPTIFVIVPSPPAVAQAR